MYKYSDKNIGEFTEASLGKCFTYEPAPSTNQWAVQHGLPHQVHFNDGITRLGLVLATVAYICIDEAPDGTPVLEKWKIKQHRKFVK